MMDIAWVDAVLLGLLAISVVIGLVRGFVFELMSLAGWVVAYFAAQWLTPLVSPHIPVGAPASAVNHAASFVVTFIAALLAWALISRLLRMLIHASPLSFIDRLLGGFFGLVRGLMLALAIATVVSMTPLIKSKPWQASQAAPWLQAGLSALRPLLPPQLSQHLPA